MKNILRKKLAFDTNILVYFIDKDSLYNNSAVSVFRKIEEKDWEVVLTQQNVTELLNVLLKYYGFTRKKALTTVSEFLMRSSGVVCSLPETLSHFLSLYKKFGKKNNIYDVYMLTVLVDNKVDVLVAENKKDFPKGAGVEVLSLREFG
ncbi:hypothetical protein DRH14_02200 [Candidatus Shapirobacteria bacterium]|nr:MAG: hypothetical protein DRH14_02200 [Candidatus Shapirobacteria bacterium]